MYIQLIYNGQLPSLFTGIEAILSVYKHPSIKYLIGSHSCHAKSTTWKIGYYVSKYCFFFRRQKSLKLVHMQGKRPKACLCVD